MSNRIAELEDSIRRYSQAYYESEPLISDEAFDKLTAELRSLDPSNALLGTAHGYKTFLDNSHLAKFKHPFFVGSLEKLKWEDIQAGSKWQSGLTSKLVASIKVDGGSGTAHYDEQGNLVRVLSRGDGEEGLDITVNVVNVPRKIHATGNKEVVRGELAITWEDFEGMEGFTAPRNAACGLSQSKNADKKNLQNVRFVAYTIYNWEHSKLDMLKTLELMGFEVVPYTVFEGFQDFVTAVSQNAYNVKTENRTSYGHHLPCDGTVLTVDGEPETQIAIKFEEESAITTLTGFEWNVSRTGRVVPTAILAPIPLAGATIGRATCNNVTWIKEMGLYPGCQVRICRSNEVIPRIMTKID